MKIKYIGDRPNTTTLGRTFFQGQPVDVSDAVYAKLKGNSHFQLVDDTPKRGPGRPKKVTYGNEN
jgi:hypothetical protein